MTKQAFEQRLPAQSKMWDTLLESLESSVYTAKAEARARARGIMICYAPKGARSQMKLAMLKTRDDDPWHDLGTGVKQTWTDMAESVRDLIERLR